MSWYGNNGWKCLRVSNLQWDKSLEKMKIIYSGEDCVGSGTLALTNSHTIPTIEKMNVLAEHTKPSTIRSCVYHIRAVTYAVYISSTVIGVGEQEWTSPEKVTANTHCITDTLRNPAVYYQQPLRRFCSKRIENGRQAATRFSPFEMMHQTRGNTHEEEEEKKTIITYNSNEKKKE